MKEKKKYLCDACGYESAKWYGKCPACGTWNSMNEFLEKADSKTRGILQNSRKSGTPKTMEEIASDGEIRFPTGISELDRVLGGGVVQGSFVLVGGEPGIGKSTLLLQMCSVLSQANKVLYVSGEESLRQIKLRAHRLQMTASELFFLAETDIREIFRQTEHTQPDVLIVDSIQTVYSEDIPSAPGNVSQIKECAMQLMQYAKLHNVTIFVVGHVNKGGDLAGPKILEHMVDCVLYFEGERHIAYRLLRAQKNRYGSTNEIGVFEMTDKGLLPVDNPSAAMLAGHPGNAPGTAIACTMEGSRPILAEIQALVCKTAFGVPRRTAAGIDYNRMVLLLAILEKRVGMALSGFDAYVNVIGGMKLDEPAIDLPLILAIASSYRDKPLLDGILSFGEIGLTGELRAVSAPLQRIQEGARLGFHTCIMPVQKLGEAPPECMKIIQVSTIYEAMEKAL